MYGTLTVADLLATTQPTVIQFGEDLVFQAIADDLAAHNAIMRENMADFVVPTRDRLRRFGGVDQMDFEVLGEMGTPDAQKVTAGQTVGFPLDLFGRAVQWTRHYFENARVSELAAQFQAVQAADVRNVDRAIRAALYKPTNLTYIDEFVDKLTLPVKALANADGFPLPSGPNGEIFNGATHTHYLFTAGTTLANADMVALGETVIEHYDTGPVVFIINRNQEAAVRSLSGFLPYQLMDTTPATTAASLAGRTLDDMRLYNRAIGRFNGIEVWVKPWAQSGYIFAYNAGITPSPLAYRVRDTNPNAGNLAIAFDVEEHPLRTRSFTREFGIGVWNRVGAAVLYIDTGAASAYVAPTVV